MPKLARSHLAEAHVLVVTGSSAVATGEGSRVAQEQVPGPSALTLGLASSRELWAGIPVMDRPQPWDCTWPLPCA